MYVFVCNIYVREFNIIGILTLEILVQELAVELVTVASEYIHGLEYSPLSSKTIVNRFVAQFGITSRHCAFLWMYSNEQIHSINTYREKNIFYGLNLLKSMQRNMR